MRDWYQHDPHLLEQFQFNEHYQLVQAALHHPLFSNFTIRWFDIYEDISSAILSYSFKIHHDNAQTFINWKRRDRASSGVCISSQQINHIILGVSAQISPPWSWNELECFDIIKYQPEVCSTSIRWNAASSQLVCVKQQDVQVYVHIISNFAQVLIECLMLKVD